MPRVVLVDDETLTVLALRDLLVRALPDGFEVVALHNGLAALTLLDAGVAVDVFIVDIHLDDIDGRLLIALMLERRPELRGKIFVSTGEILNFTDPLFSEMGCMRLDKPFEVRQMVESIKRAVP